MTHYFFIAINNLWLGLKTSHRDVEISPFWCCSPRLPMSVNNLPDLEKSLEVPRQKFSSQIIRNTPLNLCFVTALKKFF